MEFNINLKPTLKLIPSYNGIYKKYHTKRNKLQFKISFLCFEIEFKNR